MTRGRRADAAEPLEPRHPQSLLVALAALLALPAQPARQAGRGRRLSAWEGACGGERAEARREAFAAEEGDAAGGDAVERGGAVDEGDRQQLLHAPQQQAPLLVQVLQQPQLGWQQGERVGGGGGVVGRAAEGLRRVV